MSFLRKILTASSSGSIAGSKGCDGIDLAYDEEEEAEGDAEASE